MTSGGEDNVTACEACWDTGVAETDGTLWSYACPCWELQMDLADLAAEWTLCEGMEGCHYPVTDYPSQGWCNECVSLYEHVNPGESLEP